MAGKVDAKVQKTPAITPVPNQFGGIPNFATPKQIHGAMKGGTVKK